MASFVKSAFWRPFFFAGTPKLVALHVASKWSGIFVMNEAGYVSVTGCFFRVDSMLFEFFFGNAIQDRVNVMFGKETLRTLTKCGFHLFDGCFLYNAPLALGVHDLLLHNTCRFGMLISYELTSI